MHTLPGEIPGGAAGPAGGGPLAPHREPASADAVQQRANGCRETLAALLVTKIEVIENAMRIRMIMNQTEKVLLAQTIGTSQMGDPKFGKDTKPGTDARRHP